MLKLTTLTCNWFLGTNWLLKRKIGELRIWNSFPVLYENFSTLKNFVNVFVRIFWAFFQCAMLKDTFALNWSPISGCHRVLISDEISWHWNHFERFCTTCHEYLPNEFEVFHKEVWPRCQAIVEVRHVRKLYYIYTCMPHCGVDMDCSRINSPHRLFITVLSPLFYTKQSL